MKIEEEMEVIHDAVCKAVIMISETIRQDEMPMPLAILAMKAWLKIVESGIVTPSEDDLDKLEDFVEAEWMKMRHPSGGES